MSIKDFEISINASNGYVNSISKGIGEDKLSIIIEKYPNLNIAWLLTGLGDMLTCNQIDKNTNNDISLIKIELMEKMIRDKDMMIEQLNKMIEEKNRQFDDQLKAKDAQINSLLSILSGKDHVK